VFRRRKLKLAIATTSTTLAVMALSALPTASADQCTVTVTLSNGQTQTFDVNVPAGTYTYYVTVSGHSASGAVMTNTAKVCSVTLKTKGTFQCSNGHISNLAPGFSPSSFAPAIKDGNRVQVASGKF